VREERKSLRVVGGDGAKRFDGEKVEGGIFVV
jgi:hypothetical protein